jgi:very-short-patch-repair endonuclease
MATPNVQSRSRQVRARARRDHDVVSRAELLSFGYTPEAIRQRLRTGRLHRQAPGVYSVGTPNLTKHGRLMVAIKACGEGAVLSDLSAAVLWGIWRREPDRITVTVPPHRNPRARATAIRRRRLGDDEVTRHWGLPITKPLRTLIDLAAARTRTETERAINEADARNLLRADTLREAIAGRSEPGVPLIRDILDRDAFVLTDTTLEQLFVPLARRAGLPRPESQVMVNGHRVDFYFRDLDLVVEADSLRYHRTQFEQRKDKLRHQAHAAAGTTCLPFTHFQIAHEGDYVVATLISTRSAPRAAGSPSRGRPSGSRRRPSP